MDSIALVLLIGIAAAAAALAVAVARRMAKARAYHWLTPYVLDSPRRRLRPITRPAL